ARKLVPHADCCDLPLGNCSPGQHLFLKFMVVTFFALHINGRSKHQFIDLPNSSFTRKLECERLEKSIHRTLFDVREEGTDICATSVFSMPKELEK
ncbi:hypothetical protein IRJ41_015377, partial [Triplophysa rosa]